jgi:Patatin-like phospholipase
MRVGACDDPRVTDRDGVAFVLGGGGVLGAAEVGMLRALADAGILPDLVVGTSIGAINGAVVAASAASACPRTPCSSRAWTKRRTPTLVLSVDARSWCPASSRDLRFEWTLEPLHDGNATRISVHVDVPDNEAHHRCRDLPRWPLGDPADV